MGNGWINERMPWGKNMPVFDRHPVDFINALDLAGFRHIKGWERLMVSEDGKVDPERYAKYFSYRSRIAGRCMKVDAETKNDLNSGREFPEPLIPNQRKITL